MNKTFEAQIVHHIQSGTYLEAKRQGLQPSKYVIGEYMVEWVKGSVSPNDHVKLFDTIYGNSHIRAKKVPVIR